MSRLNRVGKVATLVFDCGITGEKVIRYHTTDVVRFNDEEITLNSGGWQTVTTKVRMNQASNQFGLGFGVYQNKFNWFVDFQGATLDFKDGMILKREE